MQVNLYVASGAGDRVPPLVRRAWKFFSALCPALFLGLRAAAGPDAGPLVDQFPLTLSPGHRTEILGPLFYSEISDGAKTWAISPLLSNRRDPVTQTEEFHFAYPVLTYVRFGTEYRWQLFQVFNFAGGNDQQDQTARRFNLFPIYFHQSSVHSNQSYTAVFPIYGRLLNHLFRDEIFFVMFPFYGQTRKKDVVTDNYLYPFFHLRHGNALTGWQLWPIVGHEHKDITTHTNGFGDLEITGGHERWFWIWPLFSDQRSGLGTPDPEHQQALLPFYSWLRSPGRRSTTVIWPLFSHIIDRDKGYSEWQVPWPIVVFARGEGKNTSRVLPFFEHAESSNLVSRIYLWPLYKYNRYHYDVVDRSRARVLFFLYSDIRVKNLETGKAQRRVDAWPFFTHKTDFEGRTRLQILSILEPIFPANTSIERDYSQLWSLWRSEKDPHTGASSQSLLWNLYRRDVAGPSKKCSLLFGLFQYQSGPDGKRLRLCYVPVVKTKPPAERK